MNKQRESVYALRRELLEGHIQLTEEETVDSRAIPDDARGGAPRRLCRELRRPGCRSRAVGLRRAEAAVADIYGVEADELETIPLDGLKPEEISDALWPPILPVRGEEKRSCPEILRRVERDIMLQIVDSQWKDHLYSLDHLKEGIGLRGYGQNDPLVEYKKESFALFRR